MVAEHPAMSGPIFELLRTIEIDLALSDENLIPLRIELFRETSDSSRFRCRLWEREHFRLTPSFPQDGAGKPKHVADTELLFEASTQLARDYSDFRATDEEAALAKVWQDLTERVEHWTGRKGPL